MSKTSTNKNDYIVDIDSGIITCNCGNNADDGFTIQCDNCHRWQHAICMGINNINMVPDIYLCYVCSKDFDKQKKNIKQLNNNTDNTIIPLLNITESYPYLYINDSPTNNIIRNPLINDFIKSHSNDSFITTTTTDNLNPIDTFIKQKTSTKTSNIYSNLSLHISAPVVKNTFITQFIGTWDFLSNYINNSNNHYNLLGTLQPFIFKLPQWPIIINTNFYSNNSKFIRRSCHNYNTFLQITKNTNDNNSISIILKSLSDLNKNDELTLPWYWDSNHPIQKIKSKLSSTTITHGSIQSIISSLSLLEKFYLFNSIHHITDFFNCACLDKSICLIENIKLFYLSEITNLKLSSFNDLIFHYKLKLNLNLRPLPILNDLKYDTTPNKKSRSTISNFNHLLKSSLSNNQNKKKITKKYKYPLKLQILNKKYLSTKSNSNQSTISSSQIIINNSFNSYENTDDINSLHIPIHINIPTTIHNSMSPKLSSNNTIPPIISSSNDTNNKDHSTLDFHPPSSASSSIINSNNKKTINHSSPGISKDDSPSAADVDSCKKKLSFADYRKKLNK